MYQFSARNVLSVGGWMVVDDEQSYRRILTRMLLFVRAVSFEVLYRPTVLAPATCKVQDGTRRPNDV